MAARRRSRNATPAARRPPRCVVFAKPFGYVQPMPIYDFQCRGCGHRFEQLVKADEVPACPACSAADVQRFFPFSASVSTGRTRQRSLAEARSRASATKKEKDHAHAEYLRKHNEDHG